MSSNNQLGEVMRKRRLICRSAASIMVTFCVAFLATATASAAEVQMQVDFSYRQFKPANDGSCAQQKAPEDHATTGGIFLAWIAGKIVSSLGAWAAKKVKMYTSERESDPQYGNFYDVNLWVQSPHDASSQLGCWELLERECPKSDNPCKTTTTPRLTVIGVYSRDQSVLKVVPRQVSITGLAAKVYKNAKKATIAVSQTVNAVWMDGSRGRKETMYSEIIFRKKFDYNPASQDILPPLSAPELKEAIEGSEPLPLPPMFSGRTAYVGVSFKVAEANNAPKLLTWIASFLHDKHDDLSAELASALEDL